MVTKPKKTAGKKSKVKVGKLKLNKETVRSLRADEAKKVRGGIDVVGVEFYVKTHQKKC
jgi:hypothetical protein